MKRGVLLAVFGVAIAALAAAYLFLINRPEPPPPPLPDENVEVLNVPDEDLVEIDLRTPDTELSLRRQGDAWVVPGQEDADLDPNRLLTIVSMFARLWARDVVAEDPDDLSIYGLDRGDIVGRVKLADGTERTVTFGDRTPSRNTDYIMIDGDARVFTVWQNNKNQMAWTIDDLRLRRLPRIDTATVNRLVVENDHGAMEIVRYFEPHGMPHVLSRDVMVRPYAMQRGADAERMEELINAAAAIRVDEFIADRADDPAAYGLAPPRMQLIVNHGRGVLHLQFGGAYGGDRLYVKQAQEPIIYGIDARDVQRFLDVAPFDLVSRFLALVNITAVDQVTVQVGDQVHTFDVIRAGEGEEETFTLNGAALAEDPAKDLYQAMIGLLADRDLPGDPVDGDPAIRIGYVLESGPPERIDVALIRYDQDFYAAEVQGVQEFLISARVVQLLPEAIELALTQTGN